MPIKRTCAVCGREFTTQTRNAKYCCTKCKKAAASAKAKKKRLEKQLLSAGERVENGVLIRCEVCGKYFVISGNVGSRKYCSEKCQKAAFNKSRRVYTDDGRLLVSKVCKVCGTVFVPGEEWAYTYNKQPFCSYKCLKIEKKKAFEKARIHRGTYTTVDVQCGECIHRGFLENGEDLFCKKRNQKVDKNDYCGFGSLDVDLMVDGKKWR